VSAGAAGARFLGGASIGSPAAVVLSGKLYLFGSSTPGSDGFVSLKMNNFDGNRWAGWSDVPGAAKMRAVVAATVYRDNLYLFSQDQGDMPVVATFDGANWVAWTKVGSGWFDSTQVINGVQYEVSVEVFDAVTYAEYILLFTIGVVTEVNSNQNTGLRVYSNVFDGNRWFGWSPLPEDNVPDATSANAAAVYAGKLYLFGVMEYTDQLNVFSV
jgi:hypothetical protein